MVDRSSGIPALANDNMVSFLHTEAWGYVCCNIGMPLLIPARQNSHFINILSTNLFRENTNTQKKKKKQLPIGLPLILPHIVEVISTDNDSSVHLGTMACAS